MAPMNGEATTGAVPLALEIATGANLGTIPRRVNLEFPPPPTYPPPHHNIHKNCGNLTENFTPMIPTVAAACSNSNLTKHVPFQDYSYAYYEPSTSGNNSYHHHHHQNSNDLTNPFLQNNPENYRNLSSSNPFNCDTSFNLYSEDVDKRRIYQHNNHYQQNQYVTRQMDPQKRHTYMTRYGTEENIYEEISDLG